MKEKLLDDLDLEKVVGGVGVPSEPDKPVITGETDDDQENNPAINKDDPNTIRIRGCTARYRF